ncbi:MAG TPA: LysM peptidoglycan-binding domain-containing protein [Opitutales bacterium]|nr:LysM peptidoglycan-binding domain-containing protein [Opitutales bacterium]
MKHFYAFALVAAALCLPASGALAQQNSDARRISDLEQDVQALKEQIGQMNIQMEELARINADLRGQLGKSTQVNNANLVTLSQMDAQLANLRAEMMRAQTSQKNEIIDEVGRQIERLAQQTQQAIQAQAASQPVVAAPVTPAAQPTGNFPKTGVSYTVQKGDTLSAIARRYDATIEDIKNANNITDPTKIRVGQILFIPQKAK